jgi:hypothetical protein
MNELSHGEFFVPNNPLLLEAFGVKEIILEPLAIAV